MPEEAIEVQFVFRKENFEELRATKTAHPLGKFQPDWPNRIIIGLPFDLCIRDLGGTPVEGVNLFRIVNDEEILQGTSDLNGKITGILIPAI